MFAWCQLTLLLVVVQSTFLIVNMYQGLIWFILPALLIIANDIWAYFWGFFFGKTPV
jgi:phosphatidate cytidylyltransferase